MECRECGRTLGTLRLSEEVWVRAINQRTQRYWNTQALVIVCAFGIALSAHTNVYIILVAGFAGAISTLTAGYWVLWARFGGRGTRAWRW